MSTVAEKVEKDMLELGTKIDKYQSDNKEQTEKVLNRANELEKTIKELEGKLVQARAGLAVSVPGVDEGKDKFSFQRAFYGIITNDWSESGYEREVINQTQKRAVQQASTDALGGFLIPIQVSAEIIGELRNELIVSALGVRTLANLPSGIYEFNKKKSHATAQPKSEVGVSQRTGVSFNQMRLAPHIISAYVPMSERIIRASNPAIEGIVREDLRLALAERMETGFFFGNGTGNDVTGIANLPGVLGSNDYVGTNTLGLTATNRHIFNADVAIGHRLTFEDIIMTLETYLSDMNALPRNSSAIKLATNSGVKRLLRTEKVWTYDNTATPTNTNLPYRMNMPMTDAEIEARTGYSTVTSNIIPISGANQGRYTGTYDTPSSGTNKLAFGFFGNWSEVMLALYEGMSIRASRDASDVVSGKFYSAFTQNQVWLRADMEYDVGIRHDEAMLVLNNLKTR